MAGIRTFDHCGFVVEDIPRAQQFYDKLLGAKPLYIQNLITNRLYRGWPIISFVEMGGHRFELCLAQEPLAPAEAGHVFPRIGFSVKDQVLDDLVKQLSEAGVSYEGPVTYPEAVPFSRTIRVRDADGNVLEFSVRR